MNALSGLPENVRKGIYVGYGLAGLVVGAIQVAYTAATPDPPMWLRIVLSVYLFLGTAIGATAVSNMPAVADLIQEGEVNDVDKNENGYATGEIVVLALAVLGVVLLVLLLVGVIGK